MLQIKNTLGGGKPEGLYAWKKCENDTDHTFIDYVVSDKETAYPDGAVQDGYYYEKVGGGLTPEMFGCTKYAVDEFSYTSETKLPGYNDISNINHSLGVIPKFIFIIAEYNEIPTGSHNILLSAVNATDEVWGSVYSVMYGVSGNKKIRQAASILARGKLTNTTVSLYNNESSAFPLYYGAGIKYKLITMA